MTSKAAAVLTPQVRPERIDIGLDANYRKAMAGRLTTILAATYKLIIKSHIYHWNVVGPLFLPLHQLTEEHYGTMFEAADIIAERIRALGHLAPVKLGTAAQFSPDAGDVDHSTAIDMVNDLIGDHEDAVKTMREAAQAADAAGDVVTTDMLTDRLTFHEKALWMLRATIAE